MMCFSFLCKKKTPFSGTRNVEIEDEISGILNLHRFSYGDLQLATHNFSQANKIGEGGFGSVFKGRLRDGTSVAIKVLSAYSSQGAREFLTELELITNIQHENLVQVYGCCAEGNHRIIVYGYLENNSLARRLLGGSCSNIQFDWTARHKICVGVARGLAFLHEEVHPHIIHRDIKASNILLDKDLTPKISDFGLAKLFPSHLTHVSTRIAGTAGYLAPEYAIQGQLTRKADIYSFGVLLLEIVCGRPNTNKLLPHSDRYLLERVWNFHQRNELHALVDASLQGVFVINEACQFMKVGLLCTQSKPKLRPSMSTVVKMLTGEIDVEGFVIAQPGLLRDAATTSDKDKKVKLDTGMSKMDGSSSTSTLETSFATMTFNSVFDRD
uniref:Protein kinase domain-containing protein n=1 Tax=Kalanchoe fedtschenkoi TaxID=63787 RepID=A0A7N0V976_KALFE